MSKGIHRSATDAEAPTQRHRIVWRWLLVLSYALCIFIGSAIPGQHLPHVGVSDKLLHAAEFGGLAFLLSRAFHAQLPNRSPYLIGLIGFLAATSYGVVDELHQLWVAHRVSDIADLAADSLGALLGVWGWLVLGTRWPWLA